MEELMMLFGLLLSDEPVELPQEPVVVQMSQLLESDKEGQEILDLCNLLLND